MAKAEQHHVLTCDDRGHRHCSPKRSCSECRVASAPHVVVTASACPGAKGGWLQPFSIVVPACECVASAVDILAIR